MSIWNRVNRVFNGARREPLQPVQIEDVAVAQRLTNEQSRSTQQIRQQIRNRIGEPGHFQLRYNTFENSNPQWIIQDYMDLFVQPPINGALMTIQNQIDDVQQITERFSEDANVFLRNTVLASPPEQVNFISHTRIPPPWNAAEAFSDDLLEYAIENPPDFTVPLEISDLDARLMALEGQARQQGVVKKTISSKDSNIITTKYILGKVFNHQEYKIGFILETDKKSRSTMETTFFKNFDIVLRKENNNDTDYSFYTIKDIGDIEYQCITDPLKFCHSMSEVDSYFKLVQNSL